MNKEKWSVKIRSPVLAIRTSSMLTIQPQNLDGFHASASIPFPFPAAPHRFQPQSCPYLTTPPATKLTDLCRRGKQSSCCCSYENGPARPGWKGVDNERELHLNWKRENGPGSRAAQEPKILDCGSRGGRSSTGHAPDRDRDWKVERFIF